MNSIPQNNKFTSNSGAGNNFHIIFYLIVLSKGLSRSRGEEWLENTQQTYQIFPSAKRKAKERKAGHPQTFINHTQ